MATQNTLGSFTAPSVSSWYNLPSQIVNKEGVHPIIADFQNLTNEAFRIMTDAVVNIDIQNDTTKQNMFLPTAGRTYDPKVYLMASTGTNFRKLQSNNLKHLNSNTSQIKSIMGNTRYEQNGAPSFAGNTMDKVMYRVKLMPKTAFDLSITTNNITRLVLDYEIENLVCKETRREMTQEEFDKIQSGEYVAIYGIETWTGAPGNRTDVSNVGNNLQYITPTFIERWDSCQVAEVVDGAFTNNMTTINSYFYRVYNLLHGFLFYKVVGNNYQLQSLFTDLRLMPNCFKPDDIIGWCYSTSSPTISGVGRTVIIKKEALIRYLNYLGVPFLVNEYDEWDYEMIQSSFENFPDYNPNATWEDLVGPKPGQPDNTSSDWTGAGDNSEDSFEFTTPTFSPYGSTVNQYAMSGLQVQQFIRELFEGSFITNPDLIKNDPKEGLVSCRYYPFNVRFHDPEGIGNQEDIVVGGVQMEYSAGARILPNYNQILDLGEFKVDEYFGGFLDYQLTTIDIYLPYIGWQQLPATSLMGRTLKIKYVVDIISGDCSCLLTTTDGEIERLENMFSGHMGIDIPILTSNHNENTKQAASSVLSAVTAVGGAVATYATGGIGGIAAAGISATAITNSATDIATMQNHANMGTPISSSTSLWMPQDIIFRITRPRKSEASEFKNRRGYRSNYSTQLKNVTGFVQIDDPFLDGLSLHEGEKEQLAQILKGGIFI